MESNMIGLARLFYYFLVVYSIFVGQQYCIYVRYFRPEAGGLLYRETKYATMAPQKHPADSVADPDAPFPF